jgi:hypothetical protein
MPRRRRLMPKTTDMTTDVVDRTLTPREKLIEAIATGPFDTQIRTQTKRAFSSKNVTSALHPTSDISSLRQT